MNHPQDAAAWEVPDWDTAYREGTPPWESGTPSEELVRALSEGIIRPCPVLELGCGTGADAVWMARRKFDVTAVDVSPMAIERARTRAEMADASLRFVLEDVFRFAKQNAETFDLVYDAGFYHFIRRVDLVRFLDLLWRVTKPGSLYLVMAGSDQETASGGPPQVSEETMRSELGRLFEFVHLRPCRFASPRRKEGYLGWSCLAKRPQRGA
jgi:SAM-dependent methyltransferase